MHSTAESHDQWQIEHECCNMDLSKEKMMGTGGNTEGRIRHHWSRKREDTRSHHKTRNGKKKTPILPCGKSTFPPRPVPNGPPSVGDQTSHLVHWEYSIVCVHAASTFLTSYTGLPFIILSRGRQLKGWNSVLCSAPSVLEMRSVPRQTSVNSNRGNYFWKGNSSGKLWLLGQLLFCRESSSCWPAWLCGRPGWQEVPWALLVMLSSE